MPVWEVLGEGTYNIAYISRKKERLIMGNYYSGPWVFKVPKRIENKSQIYSKPEREVRLWKQLNPSFPAALYSFKTDKGWIMPYVEGTAPEDNELANKLIEIYQRTRRIIVDAPGRGNFIKDHKTGEVVCVDVDLALNRRHSAASLGFVDNASKYTESYKWFVPEFYQYWGNEKIARSVETVKVIKTLLYLDDYLGAAPKDILNQCITPHVISALHFFTEKKLAIPLEFLEALSRFEEEELGDLSEENNLKIYALIMNKISVDDALHIMQTEQQKPLSAAMNPNRLFALASQKQFNQEKDSKTALFPH